MAKGHSSPKIKKRCVMGRMSEELNSVSKGEVLRFKREKVNSTKELLVSLLKTNMKINIV